MAGMEPTSISLLDRLRQLPFCDDCTRLVALYRPFVQRFIWLDPALSADADDICQEMMAKLVEHLPQVRREHCGSFRTWLKTITINEVNYFWRRRQRRTVARGDDGRYIFGRWGIRPCGPNGPSTSTRSSSPMRYLPVPNSEKCSRESKGRGATVTCASRVPWPTERRN
jgi:hypothetical protein